ncbi:MAG: endolytic transglycosylase MltG [Hydrogenophaga sp.]|uniref:endolytic transglycosylase MltG n=1 Tax=Hydrogenophaga sp. TaxID=1904254 RepID=UPI002718743F|nr:endolytic transglycosylase MltG [Hydrogenophaga sp.]MDO9483970.1 endolytic transglycosylase MltG [Hydrogenophaga sp.]MDP2092592.1 endolytic transglycosylase MltG [Hydrogenophaga sp.]MDP3346314.1 endolytic transglycosylase MltG [Hydrogenophaga sp.]MDP3806436.1 endolytic transglycosylase MltG [Hydrogenophaga sp.]MDP3921900.1 endolytic transglycosylase MltG [Hydrogenophaga sp.]
MRLLKLLLALTILGLGAAAAGAWWLQRPLQMPDTVSAEAPLEVTIAPGSSARSVADTVVNAGVQGPSVLLYAWFRLSGESRQIKAGSYELAPGTTPASLLSKLVRGEQALRSLTLLEGWNIRQVLQAVRSSPDLKQDIDGLSMADLMARIGYPGRHPEGRFFPDTYRMAKNTPASAVLRQAAQAMEQQLNIAWAQRAPNSPLRSPDEALILASIIEKETGLESDRAMVGGVFSNRLRIGMRLQTDPSVIYGLGERFDGNLRRVDLQTDTPYNTYTRAGLPPTPIAIPGRNSLMAAVMPATTDAMYFVARGDGASYFSATLQEHNAAVRRYILGR